MREDDKYMYLSWLDINQLVEKIINKLKQDNLLDTIDYIIAIAKGGCIPATILANIIDKPMYVVGVSSYKGQKRGKIKQYQSLPTAKVLNNKNVLVIDDIIDSGKTIEYINKNLKKRKVNNVISACLCCSNEHDIVYGIKSNKWVVFPWEKITL